jgi:predicted MFS family arabinose efflux permease
LVLNQKGGSYVGVNVLWVTLAFGVCLTIQNVLNTFLVERMDHDVAFAISGIVLLVSGMAYLFTCGIMLEAL